MKNIKVHEWRPDRDYVHVDKSVLVGSAMKHTASTEETSVWQTNAWVLYLLRKSNCIASCSVAPQSDWTCLNSLIPPTSQFLVILDPNAIPRVPELPPKKGQPKRERVATWRNASTTISGASFHSKGLPELQGEHLDTLRSQIDMSRIPASIQTRTNNHIIAVIQNAIFHISALPLASTLPCIPVFLIPGQTQIIDTFPDKWQDRSEQKTLSPPFTLPRCQKLRVELISCLLQTCYKYIWAATSLWRSYLIKCSQVHCETQISEICQDMSRCHQVCQLRRNTLDSTLDKHCLGLMFVSCFPKSSWNNAQLNTAVWREKKYLDHKQTGSNYPEVLMPCSKHKKHHSK